MPESRTYKTGRKPQHAPENRYAIPYLHELDPEVAPETPVSYPVDVSQGRTEWKMLGNGPEDPNDPVTVPMPAGDSPETGEGDCHWAGYGHDTMLAGADPTANRILTAYNAWSAQSQGVAAGHEQDQGTNMADAFVWALTHDENGNEVPQGQGMVVLFAPLHPDTIGATMAKYQRGVLVGVNCTPCDQANFPTGWTVTAQCQPDPEDGHVVYLVVLNGPIGSPTGSGEPVSWALRVPADAPWLKDCPEEWWIILTPADRAKMGDAAFDALASIMETLPGEHGSVPAPAPAPAPAPQPTPPAPTPIPGPKPAPPAPTPPGEITAWITDLRTHAQELRTDADSVEAYAAEIETWVVEHLG